MSIGFSLKGVAPVMGGNPVTKVPEGAYQCMIQSVDLDGDKALKVRVDVVEGPFTGAFDDDFAKRNPWSHEVTVNFTDYDGGQRDPALIAGDLQRISDWNEDFDAVDAFERRDWASFFGKRCCALRRYKKYRGNDGQVKDGFSFYRLASRDEASQGWTSSPKPRIPEELWGVPVDGPFSDWWDCHPDEPTPDGIPPEGGAAPEQPAVPASAYGSDYVPAPDVAEQDIPF